VSSAAFLCQSRAEWQASSDVKRHGLTGSEANKVINQFDRLTTQDHQQIIDFLRAL
jgi:hypothetical protein